MRTVVLTRPQPLRDRVTAVLHAAGVHTLSLPTLQVTGHADADFERHLVSHWMSYQGVMLVSQHAVQFAAQRLQALGLTWRDGVWAAVVGQATADAVRDQWPHALVICPADDEAQDSEGLWQAIVRSHMDLAEQRVLIVRAQMGRDAFLNHLQGAGAQVDVWSCYRREVLMWTRTERDAFKTALQQHGLVLSMTSQAGVSALLSNLVGLSDDERRHVLAQPVLTLHPSIAEYAQLQGFTHVHVAPAHEAAEQLKRLADCGAP